MFYSKSAPCTRKQQLKSTTLGELILTWSKDFLKLDLVVIITRDKWNLCLLPQKAHVTHCIRWIGERGTNMILSLQYTKLAVNIQHLKEYFGSFVAFPFNPVGENMTCTAVLRPSQNTCSQKCLMQMHTDTQKISGGHQNNCIEPSNICLEIASSSRSRAKYFLKWFLLF